MHHNYNIFCSHFGFKVQALERIRRPLPKVVEIEMPRRKPFSNKQKKQQLQDKRIRKKGKGTSNTTDASILSTPAVIK